MQANRLRHYGLRATHHDLRALLNTPGYYRG